MGMTENISYSKTLRTSDLAQGQETPFDLRPGKADLEEIAKAFGLNGLRKLRFSGVLSPLGKQDWQMRATIGATIEQACVLSGDPVVTRVDEPFEREYLRDLPEPGSDSEVEMTLSELAVPLGKDIDLVDAMLEALAINIPDYPRRADLAEEPFQETYAAPGVTPMSDEESKPFAGLKGLRDALQGNGEDTEK